MAEDNNAIQLGKRKEREDDDKDTLSHGGTLFVSNLPYTATSTDIQTLFSDFAPVRSAFVVLENGVSKGVGYVSFAIKGDAATAMETIEKDGVILDGRKLRVNWAHQKPKDSSKDESGAGKAESTPKRKNTTKKHASRPSVTQLVKDPDAIRTAVISGLPASIDQKTLWKKVRKCPGAERVDMIEGSDSIAHAVFVTPADAVHAVDRLHAHTFKGAILSVALKKRLENLERAPVGTKTEVENGNAASTVKSQAAPSRVSRLIVRNVPWDISETDLRALFLPFGPIYSITIPFEKPITEHTGEATSTDSKPRKPRARGFAFVWFFSKKDAERAIAGVNGRAVRAGAVGAPTMNKKERARLRRQLKQSQGEGGEGAEADGEEKDSGERIVAVDWALSKEKWEEAKAKGLAAADEDGDVDGDETTDSDASEQHTDSEEDSEDGSNPTDEEAHINDEDEEIEDDDMEVDGDDLEDEARSDAEEARKPLLPQTDVGTTLFIRNLPFDATEDELRTLFRTFGPLRYARITIDAESGRSRGTGFVCFWNLPDADKALEQSELLAREAGLLPGDRDSAAKKKNPFTLPSLLTPDPSSSLAQPLVLHGRTLSLARAVTRDTASRLAESNLRARERADKRNLYLLREGFPTAASAASAGMSPAERERRQASYDARQRMLKRNLALFVSRTRLSIRGIPLFVSERGLKRLALHAISEFEAEVERSERAALTEDELRVDQDQDGMDGINHEAPTTNPAEVAPAQGKETLKKSKTKNKKTSTAATLIAQAKIVRDANRADALTRAKGGRSKGYGFLELRAHADALRVLRWANANEGVGALLERWWVEELEELVKVLEMQLGKKKGAEERGERKRGEGAGGVDKEDKEDKEDGEARLRRLKQELEKLSTGQSKKTHKPLMIEFSIENSQVVGRRRDKIEASRRTKEPRTTTRARTRDVSKGEAEVEPTTHPAQKRRKLENGEKGNRKGSSTGQQPPPSTTLKEPDNENSKIKAGTDTNTNLGSLIGRKRHQRNTKVKIK